jgi:hypothetical protein
MVARGVNPDGSTSQKCPLSAPVVGGAVPTAKSHSALASLSRTGMPLNNEPGASGSGVVLSKLLTSDLLINVCSITRTIWSDKGFASLKALSSSAKQG